MTGTPRVEPDGEEAIQQRLARLQSGHVDAREDAARLRAESRRLADHYASVRAHTRVQWDARRAALNLLEDAEEARSAERRELAERRRSDEALRASEEKYRALFERMDEGYCVVEMIFDPQGKAVDFLLVDANPAFAAQTGLAMIGHRIREVIPDFEQLWLDNYGRVATTGEPMRFEGFVSGVGRWFETSAFRLGEDGSRRVAALFTNITERKKSEARLSTAVNLAQLGICDWDCSSGEMRGNDARFRMLGLDPAVGVLSTRQFVDLLHPEDRERVWPRLIDGVQTRGEYVEIYRIMRPDGIVRWISEAGRVSTWRDGKPLLVNSVLFDITTHREAEATVRENEARFRTLTDAVPQVIWTNEADGKATYFNRRWFDFSGLTSQSSVGPGWQAIVHPDDAPEAVAGWRRALADGDTFETEYRLRRADGEYRWHLGRNVPLKDDAGRTLGWFGTATDIHDLKEAEAAFAAAQEWLRLIVESAHEHAIISLDRDCCVTSWNPGAERMFGYSALEMISQSIEPIFLPEDRAAGLLQTEARRALAQGRAVGERWHLRSDGTRLWTNCALMPMTARPGGEPIGFVKIMRDETDALEARLALEQSSLFLRAALRDTERARAEAEAAGQAKDHFLAVLSHELRTPLMPIQMALGMLSQRQDLSAPVRAAHEMITRNVELEAHFINDMLDVTRIVRGKMEIVREAMDLHEAARRAVEVSLPDIEGKGQRLTVAFEAADHRLSGDAARLQQAMWNLLKNASKFTPEGGEISLRTRNEQSGGIVVEVTDSGIGLEASVIERIFNPFEQADLSTTRQYGGLGLGLAIAKGTVDAHGGDLGARSAGRGRGATFTILLPI